MTKAFSVASWNIEHFQDGDPDNPERIGFLAEQRPDVLAVYEAEGKEVWRESSTGCLATRLHHRGPERTGDPPRVSPDITAFVTQKVEFQSRDHFMRPGALLTVRTESDDYTLLFLQWRACDPRGFGLRADMIDRALASNPSLIGQRGVRRTSSSSAISTP